MYRTGPAAYPFGYSGPSDALGKRRGTGFALFPSMRLIRGLAVAVTIGLWAVIIVNSLPYFSFRRDLTFLQEKGALADNPLWRRCFYGHVLGAIVCAVTAPFLFWDRLRVRRPRMHRWLGRLYGVSVLGWAGPAGLVLALYAKGGLAGQSGFLLLGLLWWGTTARGVQTIVAGRVAEHRRWMIRSYALALSAVSFRVFQTGFFLAGLSDGPNYVLSLWLSLATSLVGGELVARRSPVDLRPLAWKGGVS